MSRTVTPRSQSSPPTLGPCCRTERHPPSVLPQSVEQPAPIRCQYHAIRGTTVRFATPHRFRSLEELNLRGSLNLSTGSRQRGGMSTRAPAQLHVLSSLVVGRLGRRCTGKRRSIAVRTNGLRVWGGGWRGRSSVGRESLKTIRAARRVVNRSTQRGGRSGRMERTKVEVERLWIQYQQAVCQLSLYFLDSKNFISSSNCVHLKENSTQYNR